MNKGLKLSNKWYFPIFLYGIYIFFINIFIHLTVYGDDNVFLKKYNVKGLNNLIDAVLFRIEDWTSRYLVEFIMAIICAFFYSFWVIFNIFFFILMIYSFIKLIDDDIKIDNAYILTGVVFLFPISLLYTAGWLATCANYLWPVSCALYASLLIKHIVLKDKIRKIPLILGILALIFAVNNEQNAAIFTVITGLVFFYCIYNRMYIKLSLLIFILSITNLLFHIFSTGNAHRYSIEIRWFPDFEMIGLIEKVQLGYMQIAANLFYSPNLMVLILCVLVFLVIRKKYDDFWIKFFSTTPLIIILLFGFFNIYLSKIYNFTNIPFIKGYTKTMKYAGIVTFDNFVSITSYIPLVIAIIVTLFLTFSIYYSINSKSRLLSLFISLIFILGIGGGTILGFSPTLYASGYRTHIIVYICLMVVIGFVYRINEETLDIKSKNIFKTILLICVILSISIQSFKIMELFDKIN